ncbi:APC family permease [Clostridium arbusti]|uniref:APC family permease n=1 Tax=Clostridium arbusti TaxID=1137848 RepID=UPI00028993B8|nr:APC family permease [Clostridium arbusti]
MFDKIRNVLLGKSLKTEELKSEKFNVFWGLPILSSDAISSVAYAGEEILWILVPAIGIMAFKNMLYVALLIVLLLFILMFSYRQTIDSYPKGGGSYIVAKDNIGVTPGLIAGSALCIDYVLTVAVSVSAGAGAITSAIPELLHYKLIICLIIVVIMTIGNLRGLKDSAKLFGIPTYLFIISMIVMIVVGIVRVKVFGYVPKPLEVLPDFSGQITFFVFLKAFAGGCTAVTGVEAVSDGIPNFEEPSQKNAKKVLLILGCIAFVLFAGISYLATMYQAVPSLDRTVVSQIALQVFGNGIMFYVIQATTALILIMAANTSYADFPLLLSIISKDGYAPRQLCKRGKRLSFSNGILFLAVAASILLIHFKGENHYLLPLYAVGVFISFTLSQFGMFMRFVRGKQGNWKHKAFISGFGAVITCITAIVIGVTKFVHGAWIVCLLIPILVFIMMRIKKHYNKVADSLRLPLDIKPKKMIYGANRNYIIVPIDTLNKSFLKALNYARSLTEDIIIFHVSVDEESTDKLKKRWEEYNVGIPLTIKRSPYRSLLGPLVKFIESEEFVMGPNDTITVVMPQFVVKKWWHHALHNQTSLFVKSALLNRRNIALTTIPYIIDE